MNIYGTNYLQQMLRDVEAWMVEHRYQNIDQFKGKMSHAKSDSPAAYERVQFMKYYGAYRK